MKRSKQQSRSYSLFEPQVVENTTSPKAADTEPSKAVDPLACPKCGNASQPAAHPMDHGGATRYCIYAACAVEGEPFYFKP